MRKILDALALKAEAMWPAICYKGGGSRARQAAKLVNDGSVQPLGNGVFQVGGKNQASYRENFCSCLDRAPVDTKHGKLCKHRLAIMFASSKAVESFNPWLNERVADVMALRESQDSALDWFELVFESDYDAPGVKRLVGYSLNGSTVTRFMDSGDVTLAQIQQTAASLGIGLTQFPRKLAGWSYAFRFAPGGNVILGEAAWAAKGITDAMLERAKWQLGPEEAARLRSEIRVSA
ncbi:MAG: hypothetical protein AAF702_44645 [Chloroflexota bacterium]